MEEIEILRKEIEGIDEKIIELIQRRLEIARKIGQIKRSKGMFWRDLSREANIEERWITLFKEKNMPEDLARDLVRILIKYSLAVQITSGTNSKKIALIGYGGMARTLGEMMKLAGHKVMIGGKHVERVRNFAISMGYEYGESKDIIREGDYVIIALSREAFTSGYVDELAMHMKGKIVMDILSAKAGIFEKLTLYSKKFGFKYISTHPLFGPSYLPYGETIVLIPSDSSHDEIKEVMEFWSSMGLVVVIAEFEEHERAMAAIQVLPHLYMLVLSEAMNILLKKYGIEYERFRTYNMKRIEEIIGRIKSNVQVIKEIQIHNKYASEARKLGIEVLIKTAKNFEEEII
jgi:chorismate mutase/prephenate dehydrogenase